MRPDIPPGSVMLPADHINFSGLNPLIGEQTDARFVPMTEAHDPALRAALARRQGGRRRPARRGLCLVFRSVLRDAGRNPRDPNLLGGDAVGMSTVPEVILARFLGLQVAAMSIITNMAAGMRDENISHAHTKAMAPLGAAKLERILRGFLVGAKLAPSVS